MKANTFTTEILDVNEANVLNSICDSFIFGSDSLWGGGYEYQLYSLDGILFGSKIRNGKNIVSFSTSFGSWEGTSCSSVEQQYVSMLLKRFQHISVREKSGIALCEEEFGVKASWTLDPVWLLPAEEYEKVMDSEADLPDEFIFAYIFQPLPDKLNMIKYLSDKLGKKVVFVPDLNEEHRRQFGEFKIYDFIYYDSMTVPVWLTAVKNADFVITDSYHGMCFSIIFRKQFAALYPRDGMGRFADIQSFLNISDRINIRSTDEIEKALFRPIDYTEIESILNKKIEHDRDELRDTLKKTRVKYMDTLIKELEDVILAKKILKKLN